MKLRILSYGAPATHERIVGLSSVREAVSISDFDAFVYGPDAFSGDTNYSSLDVARRQTEITELLQKKGGVLVYLLQRQANALWLIERAADSIGRFLYSVMRDGAGSQFRVLSSAQGVSGGYFQVLRGMLHFWVSLEASQAQLAPLGGTVFAVNSVDHPIAFEFLVGEGRICFLPPPNNAPPDRLGAAIVKIIATHFTRTASVEAPGWAGEIAVPGADIHNQQIGQLQERMQELETQISSLKEDRDNLLAYVGLLFGYGKAVLEPVVRTSFRLLGFTVPEPEEYDGEWDVELLDEGSGRTALGEVEGSEGVIDVDKYRQLLDYVEAEAQEGRNRKGILIGNGFRLLAPDTPERGEQFSDHARRGAVRNQFCLLPTTELFKAVCAVLEAKDSARLKAAVRNSILATTGVWVFVKE